MLSCLGDMVSLSKQPVDDSAISPEEISGSHATTVGSTPGNMNDETPWDAISAECFLGGPTLR